MKKQAKGPKFRASGEALFPWDWEEYERIVDQIEREGLEYSLRKLEAESVREAGPARGRKRT